MMPLAPLPVPDADSAPFWTACREGRLTAQCCPECGRFRWPPAEYCPWCHHHGGVWVSLPGTGVVRSFVVVHRAFDPAFADAVPYVVAHIALDGAEGVTQIGNVRATAVDPVSIGQRVAVAFEPRGAMAMPYFRPVDSVKPEESAT